MNDKIKLNEIPQKILSQNIFILQDFNKELENECISKDTKNISNKFLIQTLFNLLNSQIALIFQLSKINNSMPSQNSNDLVEHILSFNKDIMMKQIQKIISSTNNDNNNFIKPLTGRKTDLHNKKMKNNNIYKKELNKSFLTNTSLKISNKSKFKIKNYKAIMLDTTSSQDLTGYCMTHPNDNKENDKNDISYSLRENITNKNSSIKKSSKIRTIDNNNPLNSKIISFIKNKNKCIYKNRIKNINKLGNNDFSLSYIVHKGNEENEKVNDNNNNEEENPVRKVKNIIINAKKNSSLNKDRYKYDTQRNKINNENDNKIQNINSTSVNTSRYKKLYKVIVDSFNEIKPKKNNNITSHDKSISSYGNISFRVKKEREKDRESMQLLHDGMINIKNKLIYKKIHQKD